jgi:basic membrane protein A
MIKNLAFSALVVLATVLVFAFACRNRNDAVSGQDQIPGGEITVRLLTDAAGVDDKSYNAAAWRGILEFYGDTLNNTKKKGILYDVVTATPDMYLSVLMQTTEEEYDLIIVAGSNWAEVLGWVARDNPGQKYLIVDTDWPEFPNVMKAVYAEHEGSYLVGAAAALKAREDGIANPRFGFIGGVPDAVISKFEVGFVQGVLSVIPDAQILDYYVNTWSEPDLAKTQARNWYDSGVYAIYSAAGESGNGTIAQAREYRASGRNVWAVGVDSDQHDLGLYGGSESAVLTSMLKRVETSLIYGLEAVKDDTFRGDVVTFNLVRGGVDYSATNSALTPDIKTRLESIKQKIINGDIVVADTHEEAKKLPGFPQNLKAYSMSN